MPRTKAEPIVQVLAFFETVDLVVAEIAFTLVKTVMHNRQIAEHPPEVAPVKPKRSHKKKKPQDVPLSDGSGKTLIEEAHERAAAQGR